MQIFFIIKFCRFSFGTSIKAHKKTLKMSLRLNLLRKIAFKNCIQKITLKYQISYMQKYSIKLYKHSFIKFYSLLEKM